jgi:hypothetical protein
MNMKKTVKSEIKATIEKALSDVIQQLKIAKPSKKTRKAISRAGKALRTAIKSAMKKEVKNVTGVRTSRNAKDTTTASA